MPRGMFVCCHQVGRDGSYEPSTLRSLIFALRSKKVGNSRARAHASTRARASTRTRTPLHQLHRSTVHGQARPPHRVRRSVRRMRSHPALVALYAFRTCRAQSRVCRCSPLRRSQGWTISCADWRRWRPTVAPMEALQGRARPRAPHPAAAPNSRRAKPGVRLGEYSSAAYRPPSTLETHSPIQKKPARI